MRSNRWQKSLLASVVLALGVMSTGVISKAEVATESPKAAVLPAAPTAITWTATSDQISAYMKAQAERMSVASDTDAIAIREQVVEIPQTSKTKPGNPSATFMQSYGSAASQYFGNLVRTGSSTSALNSIILIAQLKNSDADGGLVDGLQNKNSAVRLWAARGLNEVWGGLKQISFAYNKDVEKLVAAIQEENSWTVKAEMARSLAHSGHASSTAVVVKTLGDLVPVLKAGTPNSTNLDAANTIFNAVTELPAGAIAKPNDAAVAKATIEAMNAIAQPMLNMKEDEAKGKAYKAVALDVLQSACKLLNTVRGQTVLDANKLRNAPNAGEIIGIITDLNSN